MWHKLIGRAGADGISGKDGKDGMPGIDGQNGVNGKDGEYTFLINFYGTAVFAHFRI